MTSCLMSMSQSAPGAEVARRSEAPAVGSTYSLEGHLACGEGQVHSDVIARCRDGFCRNRVGIIEQRARGDRRVAKVSDGRAFLGHEVQMTLLVSMRLQTALLRWSRCP